MNRDIVCNAEGETIVLKKKKKTRRMINASAEMGPPTVGEAVLALMTALKGSTQDLEPAINQGGHRRIKELVAECCHDAGALLELRNELDEATVDGFLEELKEYKRKAIIIAKKYYDEGIEMVEALLGAWGSPGPQSPSKNSKTLSGEASKAPLGGPPPQGRGNGWGGSSSFLPSPFPDHPRAQSSPDVTAQGSDSRMTYASAEMGPPTVGEAVLALMKALKGSTQDLEPAINQGEHRRIKELVAECCHDAGALLELRNELDEATVDGFLEELKEYKRKAIIIAKKYYDEGIEMVEALLGAWGSPGPQSPSKNSKTLSGEASKAPLGGPPPQGRGKGRGGSSSFLPSPSSNHPRAQSSPDVTAQGSDSRMTNVSAEMGPPTVGEAVLALMKALKGSTEDLEPAINQGGHRCIEELVAECCHDAGALLELRNELDKATVDGFLEELKESKRKAIIIAKKYHGEGIEMVEALLGAWGSPGPQSPSKNSKTPSGEASKAPLGGPPPQGRGNGWGGSSSFLPSPFPDHPRAQSSPDVTAQGSDSRMTNVSAEMGPPTVGEAVLALMKALKGSTEDLEPAINQGGHRCIEELVAECCHDAGALLELRNELDEATVDGFLEELKEYKRKAIIIAKKYYDEGIEMVEALLGAWGSPGPQSPSKNSKTPSGEASKAPLGGPPPQGRGKGRGGSSSFLPSPSSNHPRAQSSPDVTAQGSDSRMTNVSAEMGPPTVGEAVLALMKALKGSTEDLEPAINQGGHRCIEELVAECCHDAGALLELRNELDEATVDGFLEELKEYKRKAIIIAKKYYDEGIEMVEALLGAWGSPGPQSPSKNSKTPSGEASKAPLGGPPPQGRGKGRGGSSSFLPSPSSNHPRAQSSPDVTAQGSDSRMTNVSAEMGPPTVGEAVLALMKALKGSTEDLEPAINQGGHRCIEELVAECCHDAGALLELRNELDKATVDGFLEELKESKRKAIIIAKKYHGEGIEMVEALLGAWGSPGPQSPSKNSKTPSGEASKAPLGGPPPQGRGNGWGGSSSFLPSPFPDHPRAQSSPDVTAQGSDSRMTNVSAEMGPPTVGEAVLALMKALKGSTEDLEPAINQGGHRCIEELVAECCHDAGALLELRNELDEATVDGFLEELKEYKRKAIIIAKKYYDEGIEMVEALLGAWGSPGPQSPSKNSKTPSGEASKAPLGGPPPQGRGKGRGGSSSFLPSPSSNHPRAQSSPDVTAQGSDSRMTNVSAEMGPPHRR